MFASPLLPLRDPTLGAYAFYTFGQTPLTPLASAGFSQHGDLLSNYQTVKQASHRIKLHQTSAQMFVLLELFVVF